MKLYLPLSFVALSSSPMMIGSAASLPSEENDENSNKILPKEGKNEEIVVSSSSSASSSSSSYGPFSLSGGGGGGAGQARSRRKLSKKKNKKSVFDDEVKDYATCAAANPTLVQAYVVTDLADNNLPPGTDPNAVLGRQVNHATAVNNVYFSSVDDVIEKRKTLEEVEAYGKTLGANHPIVDVDGDGPLTGLDVFCTEKYILVLQMNETCFFKDYETIYEDVALALMKGFAEGQGFDADSVTGCVPPDTDGDGEPDGTVLGIWPGPISPGPWFNSVGNVPFYDGEWWYYPNGV